MRTRDLTLTAAFAALLCVVSPWTLNLGPVPLSLATLGVYLAGAVLGWRRAAAAVTVYLLLGGFGLPVFSNFSGGFQKLAGVTGGYLVGYLPLALITGLFWEKDGGAVRGAFGMLLGTALLYLLGTVWFCVSASAAPGYAMTVCVLPFLPGDAAKIAAAALLAPRLRAALREGNGKSGG